MCDTITLNHTSMHLPGFVYVLHRRWLLVKTAYYYWPAASEKIMSYLNSISSRKEVGRQGGMLGAVRRRTGFTLSRVDPFMIQAHLHRAGESPFYLEKQV